MQRSRTPGCLSLKIPWQAYASVRWLKPCHEFGAAEGTQRAHPAHWIGSSGTDTSIAVSDLFHEEDPESSKSRLQVSSLERLHGRSWLLETADLPVSLCSACLVRHSRLNTHVHTFCPIDLPCHGQLSLGFRHETKASKRQLACSNQSL